MKKLTRLADLLSTNDALQTALITRCELDERIQRDNFSHFVVDLVFNDYEVGSKFHFSSRMDVLRC